MKLQGSAYDEYEQEGKAIFTVGIACRLANQYNPKFLDKVFIRSNFDGNIKKIYYEAMALIKGNCPSTFLDQINQQFFENYSDNVEALSKDEKVFYIGAGSSFAGEQCYEI